VAGSIALMLISFALAWGLAALIDSVWLGFLLVGLMWAIVAGALFIMGRQQLQEVDPLPRQTMDELEEDKKWLSEQTN
jgi:high-affinity Fe2+/Pb2+ permease